MGGGSGFIEGGRVVHRQPKYEVFDPKKKPEIASVQADLTVNPAIIERYVDAYLGASLTKALTDKKLTGEEVKLILEGTVKAHGPQEGEWVEVDGKVSDTPLRDTKLGFTVTDGGGAPTVVVESRLLTKLANGMDVLKERGMLDESAVEILGQLRKAVDLANSDSPRRSVSLDGSSDK